MAQKQSPCERAHTKRNLFPTVQSWPPKLGLSQKNTNQHPLHSIVEDVFLATPKRNFIQECRTYLDNQRPLAPRDTLIP